MLIQKNSNNHSQQRLQGAYKNAVQLMNHPVLMRPHNSIFCNKGPCFFCRDSKLRNISEIDYGGFPWHTPILDPNKRIQSKQKAKQNSNFYSDVREWAARGPKEECNSP